MSLLGRISVDFIFQDNMDKSLRTSIQVSAVALTQHATGGVESAAMQGQCFNPSQ